MAQCDLCGANSELSKSIIEGALMSVCRKCISFGNGVEIGSKEVAKRKVDLTIPEVEEAIVQDYSEKIKSARERENLTQEFLAKALGERESLIQKIEAGHTEPSLSVAKKLENFLKINLIESIELKAEKKTLNISDSSMTIGDLLKLSKK